WTCTKTSEPPPSGAIKPYPRFVLKNLTRPVGIAHLIRLNAHQTDGPEHVAYPNMLHIDDSAPASSPARHSCQPLAMHRQIVEAAEQLTRRYVANRSRCYTTRIGWAETGSASGTDKWTGELTGQLFGPGAIPLSNIGSMGGESGPQGRCHRARGRARS